MLLPTCACIIPLFCVANALIGTRTSRAMLYAQMLCTLPEGWLPVLNPLITMLAVRPYRHFLVNRLFPVWMALRTAASNFGTSNTLATSGTAAAGNASSTAATHHPILSRIFRIMHISAQNRVGTHQQWTTMEVAEEELGNHRNNNDDNDDSSNNINHPQQTTETRAAAPEAMPSLPTAAVGTTTTQSSSTP